MAIDPHILGAYSFVWNPDTIDIVEKEKTIAVEETYTGSAIFQWPAIIQGQKVIMGWDLMSIAQYDSLIPLYLSPDIITWDPQYGLYTYQVVVTRFKGEYVHVSLEDIPYRINVELELNIRSRA